MNKNSYSQLKSEIKRRLPEFLTGIKAHKVMAPYSRDSHQEAKKNHPNAREAGVLMLLYIKNKEIYFALIKRPSYEGVHSAQVSFPGGKKEKNEIISATALRETEEEIGIKKEDIHILGALTPIYIPPSNMLVHPFIGCYDSIPYFKKDDREVEYIIEVTLQQLLDDRNIQQIDMELGKPPNNITMKNVPYFAINNEIIWGATAMILNEAKVFYKSIGLPF